MRRFLWLVLTMVACGDDAPVMVDAPTMQNTDAPLCQPQSAVGSFYRRTPSPRIVAGTHVFADNMVDQQLFDPDLMWDGTKWHLYYSTTHGTTFGVIRHATSTDLVAWTFSESPAIPLTSDQVSVAKLPDGRFLMAYVDTLGTGGIATAISQDPASFPAGSAAVSKSDVYPGIADAVIEDPELVVVGTTLHMWFASRDCSNEPCTKKGIGHATSTNGTTWMLDSPSVPSLLRSSADPASGGSAPAVIYDDIHCRYEMWLANDSPATENDNQPTEVENMVGVWHATSTNGTSWSITYTQLRDLVWDGTVAGEHLGLRVGADVAIKGGGRYLLYTGYDDQNVPTGYTLPTRSGTTPGVMTLNLATRDAPP